MDSTLIIVIILLLGLGAGAAFGWFFGSRPLADLRIRLAEQEGGAKEADVRFRTAIKELGDAQIELATLQANAANFDTQKRSLIEAQESLKQSFEVAGAKILGAAQEALLSRAQERFTQSEEKNEARIKALLEPVGQRLKSYEEQVTALEKQRVDGFGQLAGVIEEVRKGQEEVKREAQRLGNSLTNAPKARGRWGERALQNVLEQ